jgi:hypothetical protein
MQKGTSFRMRPRELLSDISCLKLSAMGQVTTEHRPRHDSHDRILNLDQRDVPVEPSERDVHLRVVVDVTHARRRVDPVSCREVEQKASVRSVDSVEIPVIRPDDRLGNVVPSYSQEDSLMATLSMSPPVHFSITRDFRRL